MHTEGIPRGDEAPRGPSMQATERVAMQEQAHDAREQALEAKGEEYKEVQKKIIAFEADLARGNERAATEKNAGVQKLAIALGRKLNQEIQALTGDKERLEEEIRNLGGNPSDYTIQ